VTYKAKLFMNELLPIKPAANTDSVQQMVDNLPRTDSVQQMMFVAVKSWNNNYRYWLCRWL